VIGGLVVLVTAVAYYPVAVREALGSAECAPMLSTLGRMRTVLRFLASVMMVSGALLITDAVVTLLWEEPVSAVVAEREQAALEDALFDPPERVLRREPLEGDAIARIEIPAIGVSEYVVEGTDTGDLRKGPGHYPDTPLPGDPGTSAIAGHRTTYGAPFRDIDDLKPGQVIRVDMPDGRFIYRVERVAIVDDQDLSVLEPVGYRRLMLSACHPLYSAAERVIVFARQVRREAAQVRRG
jgi:sortase A